MKAVFVDTGGWMACADRSDPAHLACTAARDAALDTGDYRAHDSANDRADHASRDAASDSGINATDDRTDLATRQGGGEEPLARCAAVRSQAVHRRVSALHPSDAFA